MMTRRRVATWTAVGALAAGLVSFPTAHAAGMPRAHDSGATRAAAQSGRVVHTVAIRHTKNEHDGHGTLVVVRAGGGVRTIGKVADRERIDDVSTDGRKVVTYHPESGWERITVWDTKTGHHQSFRASGDEQARFAGHRLVVGSGLSTATLNTASGTPLHRYKRPMTPFLTSDDGKYTVFGYQTGTTWHLKVIRTSTGATVQTVRSPKGMRGCTPTTRWDKASFEVVCSSKQGRGGERPYRVEYASTTKLKPLAPIGAGYAANSAPVRVTQPASGGCAAPPGYYKGSTFHELQIGGKLGYEPVVLAGSGSSVYLWRHPCVAKGRMTVERFDLKSKKLTNLAGTKGTGGGIITSVVAVPAR